MTHWAILGNKPSPAKVIAAYQAGRISDDALWRLLSDYNSPFTPKEAMAIYDQLGFISFSRYPLVRRNNDRQG